MACEPSARSASMFQLTAARRRLPTFFEGDFAAPGVSTHSRPKAAALACSIAAVGVRCFNSQPPEGGCLMGRPSKKAAVGFNSQPPEGGCRKKTAWHSVVARFQLTAARRRLLMVSKISFCNSLFQLTAARRRLPSSVKVKIASSRFQLTAARRRLRYLFLFSL